MNDNWSASKGSSICPCITEDQIKELDLLQKVDIGLLVSVPDYEQRRRHLEWYLIKARERRWKGNNTMEIEKAISRFARRQLEKQRAAKKKEKIQVCIKPDSYIGKEIQYQTAILHEILQEVREINRGSYKVTPKEM